MKNKQGCFLQFFFTFLRFLTLSGSDIVYADGTGLIHFSGSLALHVNFDKSVLFLHSSLSLRQKLILHEIFWLPFPALLNEKDLKENLKLENIKMSNIFRDFFFKNNHIRDYLKSDVLSIVPEVLIAEMTEAKHWFSITSTFFEASATSITWQSSTNLKKSISVKSHEKRVPET